MWRISLMAAAHGDPLRQSQRRGRQQQHQPHPLPYDDFYEYYRARNNERYPIDFQVSPSSCTDEFVADTTESTSFRPPLSAPAAAASTFFFPPDGSSACLPPPTPSQLQEEEVFGSSSKKDTNNVQPLVMSLHNRIMRQAAASLRHGWRRFTRRPNSEGRPPDDPCISACTCPYDPCGCEHKREKKITHAKTSSQRSSCICWSPTCLSVDPTLPCHYRWLVVVSLAVLYNVIFVVGRAVFWKLNHAVPASVWWILDYTCDTIYLVDTVIHAHEGYLEQGLLVQNAGLLRQHYFLTGRWKTDLFSLLPTDVTYLWWWWQDLDTPFYSSTSSAKIATVPCPVIVRLNRLFRLPRLREFFDRTETGTGYPNAFRICKVVLAILVLIHWNACFYFAISYYIGFGTDNWVYNTNGEKNSSLTRQYIYSFYWSTLTLTTIGETPQPENDLEYLFVVADFLAGVLIFATIVGNIGSMISNMNLARVDFQNRMDGVKQYMTFRKVSKELEERVIRWFAYTWANKQALDEDRVLAALPDKLKAEIAIHVHLDTLKQVRIFQDCEPGLLEELVLKLRLQVFSPGDYICRKGDVGKEMYIVKRGRLSVVADDGITVLATLGAGSVFGEVSVLEIAGNKTGNRRTANVRSLGYSDLFCLAKRDLWEALVDYPEARYSLMERGCQLLRKDGLLDETAFHKSQMEHETLKDKIDRLENAVHDIEKKMERLFNDLTLSSLNQTRSSVRKSNTSGSHRVKRSVEKSVVEAQPETSCSCLTASRDKCELHNIPCKSENNDVTNMIGESRTIRHSSFQSDSNTTDIRIRVNRQLSL